MKYSNLSKEFLRKKLNPALFYSYDFFKIDFDQSYFIIIEQVLSKGNWKEFKATLLYYGKEKMKMVAKESRILDPKSVYFLSSYFQISLNEFYSFKSLTEKKNHWVY